MKKCLICQKSLKWVKFKCTDGYVCKECYEIVSLSFSQIIKQKTKSDLIEIYEQRLNNHSLKKFDTTRAINQLILFDDKNNQICLPNHSKYSLTSLKPEYFLFSELIEYKLNQKQTLKKIDKKEKIVGTIEVVLTFNNNIGRSIWLVPNPIQVDSLAYKTMESLANKVIVEIGSTCGGAEYVS